jgi:hypothetical protein
MYSTNELREIIDVFTDMSSPEDGLLLSQIKAWHISEGKLETVRQDLSFHASRDSLRRVLELLIGCDCFEIEERSVKLTGDVDIDCPQRMLLRAFTERLMTPQVASDLFFAFGINPGHGVRFARMLQRKNSETKSVDCDNDEIIQLLEPLQYQFSSMLRPIRERECLHDADAIDTEQYAEDYAQHAMHLRDQYSEVFEAVEMRAPEGSNKTSDKTREAMIRGFIESEFICDVLLPAGVVEVTAPNEIRVQTEDALTNHSTDSLAAFIED